MLILPNLFHALSVEYTQPRYLPLCGLLVNSISPAVPADVGVAIPTVYFLETVAVPCRNRDDASIPLVEDDVTLLLKTTGPLNSEIALLLSPPSTLIDDEKSPSVALTISIPFLVEISSPVTVRIGVLNISSLPVIGFNFLLPANRIPRSLVPEK